mmetsp:Transcript_50521/g.131444  ORF Transcript_50521/g.131444 Transcript_50521/m.131444 type:complete len:285 (+) Transcript_50521:620-1474(+)
MRAAQRLTKGTVVRHDDDGSRVGLERLEQRGDRVDVEMVRRLVEQEHIARREAKRGERDACLFAAAQRADLPQRLLTHQPERAHHGSAALILKGRVVLSHGGHDIVERALRLRELLRQILRKEAEPQLVVDLPRARHQLQAPGERLEDRGLARAVRAAQDEPSAARHVEIARLDDRLCALGMGERGAAQRERAPAARWRIGEHQFRLPPRADDERLRLAHLGGQPIELSLPVLGLLRLRGLGSHAVDEALQARGLALLCLHRRHRSPLPLLALLCILGEGHRLV